MSTDERLLQEIRELLVDSALGYAEAARRADDGRLKELLKQLGAARRPMAEELDRVMGHSGGSSNSGTFKGLLHRLWMASRDLLSNTDNVNMLAECERGESYLIGRYDTALRAIGGEGSAGRLLALQRISLLASLGEIKGLTASINDQPR